MRSPNWTRDELILALDLYFRTPEARTDAAHPQVYELSQLLCTLPIHSASVRPDNFRNANSIAMKLRNFVAQDEARVGKGLRAGSQLEQEVWQTFSSDIPRLETTREAILDVLESLKSDPLDFNDPDLSAEEGQLLLRSHFARERNRKIASKKKEVVLKATGALACEVCEFDFFETYGEIGFGFAECHHSTPLFAQRQRLKTRLSDLNILCANCHRMIHRSKKWLTVSELKQLLRQ